ncbi:unnamed protein product [Symbiodinium microadriaticum]|nr:unnamed protein product [Symbiodinium microadriaticum]
MDNSISDLISYDGTRHFYMNSEWKYANGVVVRLAIPITMLLILAGATFWVGHPESRITATTGLLIAITAIYIVLIGNVPFVGYATRIDSFVLVMLGVLAGVIVVHVFHMLVYRHIYTDEEDTRTLVKYSQPMRFLRSLLMDWCRACCGSPDDRLKYAALSEVGEAAAMKATSRVRKDRVRGDDDSKQAASRTNREKEQMHPVLTMTMLVTQSVGRITVIPAVLQFCARMLLLDAKSLALTCHVIAFSMLAVVTVWELWCLLCKYWELQSVRDPFKELREHLMLSYDLLIMRAKHLPMLEAYSSFSHLMKMHADMLTEQRQWFEKMCVAGQLPSPNRQVGLVASQAHLMRTHDRVAKVLESSYGISVFNHPSDLGVLDEHTLAASGEVNSAYSNLLHFVHTILRIYPGIQSQISKLYGFDEKPCGAATEEVKFNDELIMK